jgi:hypothetical protein
MTDVALLAETSQPPALTQFDLLVFSTVRIECELSNRDIATGTGFYFQFPLDADKAVPVIVTNKHVVDGAVWGRFSMHRIGQDGQPSVALSEAFAFDQFQARWIAHPDASVDLCVLPIAPLLADAGRRGMPLAPVFLEPQLVPGDGFLAQLNPLEDVIMIGYPNGIWDSRNNMPISRKGITATHPAIDYEGRKEFMIDAACFPGSSGSPVFLYNTGSYARRGGGVMVGTRLMLLGILYAGPQHTATGEVRIVNVPTRQAPVAFSRIPNNLGLVIKSSRLLEFDGVIRRRVAGS